MEPIFCQSCGMPLTEELKGTNEDGSKNEDYCIYCFKDGKFTQECTMEEMIQFCAQFVDEVNKNPVAACYQRAIHRVHASELPNAQALALRVSGSRYLVSR